MLFRAPNIWIKKPYLEIVPNIPRVALRGWYEFFKTYPNGVRECVGRTPNLILNNGLNLAFTSGNPVSQCWLGTSTATPAVTDTGIISGVTGAGNSLGAPTNSVVTSPTHQRRSTHTYRFAIGVLNGNYNEVGVGVTSSNLYSRARIVDSGGTPTTLSVTSAEQLDVAYTVADEVNTVDVPFSADISGVTYTGFLRRHDANNALNVTPNLNQIASAIAYSGTLAAYTSGTLPTGNLGSNTSITQAAYTSGNYYRDATLSWNTTVGNGSIKSVMFQANGNIRFGLEFDTALVKTNLQTLALVMRLAMARV